MQMAAQRTGRGVPRPRVSNACLECRRRKVRCDLAKPNCSRCATNRVRCEYESEQSPGQLRFQFVEDPSMPVADQESPPAETSVEGGETNRFQDLERRLETLHEQVQELRTGVTRLPSSPETNMPRSKRQRRTVTMPDEMGRGVGYLSINASGKTKYMSKTHWASVLEEIEEISNLLKEQERYEVSLAVPDGNRSTTVVFGGGLLAPPPAWNSAVRTSSKFQRQMAPLTLPSKAACDALFSAFLFSVHPLMGIIDCSNFRKQYHQFWQNPSRNQGDINMPLLTAVLFCGSAVCTREVLVEHFSGRSRQQVTTELYLLATRALKWACFPRAATVESLNAYAMIQPMWMREEEPLRILSFVGVLVRVAQILGLNRDPAHFATAFSEAQAEVRRSVWWHVFTLDMNVALASGLPPLIDRDSYDVKPPSLSSGESPKPGQAVTTASIFHRLKYELKEMERSLLDRTFNSPIISEDEAAEMLNELASFTQSSLKAKDQIEPNTSNKHYTDNPTLNRGIRYIIDLVQHKNWWFLYKPMIQLLHEQQSAGDLDKVRETQGILAEILEHCRIYVEGFIDMICIEAFRLFHWCWPGIMQPLHQILILLREVERDTTNGSSARVTSPQSAQVRHTIDEALALSGVDGGMIPLCQGELMQRPLTEGGQEAWTLIRRVRERIWEDLGWNPHILPTRQQVTEDAIARYKIIDPAVFEAQPHVAADIEGTVQEHRSSSSGDLELTALLGGGKTLETPNLEVDELDALFEV